MTGTTRSPAPDHGDRIRQLKGLIKKYHPDLCTDETQRTLYQEITIKLTKRLNDEEHKGIAARGAPTAKEAPPNPGMYRPRREQAPFAKPGPASADLCTIRDQSYAYYRQGIRYYQRIHPRRFYTISEGPATRTFKPIRFREQLATLRDIFSCFSRAEYNFNRVVEEYPDSIWYFDSARKLKILSKLKRIYQQWITE
jgi:hypothetical protein